MKEFGYVWLDDDELSIILDAVWGHYEGETIPYDKAAAEGIYALYNRLARFGKERGIDC